MDRKIMNASNDSPEGCCAVYVNQCRFLLHAVAWTSRVLAHGVDARRPARCLTFGCHGTRSSTKSISPTNANRGSQSCTGLLSAATTIYLFFVRLQRLPHFSQNVRAKHRRQAGRAQRPRSSRGDPVCRRANPTSRADPKGPR